MKKHSGFTLVEVIIVAVIVSIVAALVIPKLMHMKKRGMNDFTAEEFPAVESFNLSGQAVNFFLGEGDTTVFIES